LDLCLFSLLFVGFLFGVGRGGLRVEVVVVIVCGLSFCFSVVIMISGAYGVGVIYLVDM
jgi:hypothetical protein